MAQCSHQMRGKVRMTSIERIAEECMGMTARQANLHLHAAMDKSRRNILATRRRPARPIISDRTPEWVTRSMMTTPLPYRAKARERSTNCNRIEFRTVTNEDLETMYDHGEA